MAEVASEIEADAGVEVVKVIDREKPAAGVVADEEALEVTSDTFSPLKCRR
jgi:hypothetical protein